MTRVEALVALLALPPPAAWPAERAGHERFVLPHDRDPDVIKRDLGRAYVEWRRQDYSGGDVVVAV